MEKFIHVELCDSTQDLLKEQLTPDMSGEFTVSCEQQLKGKGRGDNQWIDGSGTICFSMTLLLHEKPSFTALEVSLLISHFFKLKGKHLELKWPNDLLNDERKKCGGILIQNYHQRYFAGIGINLFILGDQFGGVYDLDFPIEKKDWARDISQFIRSNRYKNTEQLTKDWMKNCAHLDTEVVVTEQGKTIKGVFKGLGAYGEALIENSSGRHVILNGSLSLI
jgi:BirA family biotin operon repressor/biotin-[acetyl-CoA-carboxylase] ligase